MQLVRAKKHLGQHFLTDKNIAQKIVNSLEPDGLYDKVLEVGAGMGVLSDFLLARKDINLTMIDIDLASIDYLKKRHPSQKANILHADFLRCDLTKLSENTGLGIIGNFPYHISSDIIFKIIDNRMHIPQVVGMFQKEVAERIAAPKGNKTYGIVSVLAQAYFQVSYLFTVEPTVFTPAPKVQSGVIKLQRHENFALPCDEILFKKVVKAGFAQRRKKLRNALSGFGVVNMLPQDLLNLRAEQLDATQFIAITQQIMR